MSAHLQMYLKWTACAIASFIALALNLVLAPLAVPFARDGRLPRGLSWLQTPDNSLDGDNGWKTEHMTWLNARGDRLDALRRYVKRVLWLYRNPMYGFDFAVLGAKCRSGDSAFWHGDPHTGIDHPGTLLILVYRGTPLKPIYFQWYYVRAWGRSNRRLRINLGWKLWGFHGQTETLQCVCSINPFSYYKELPK